MGTILTLIFIGLICWKIYSHTNRASIEGKKGERSVASTLASLEEDGYIVMNDLMFRDGNYTTQIDHMVISVHGIFVIETKNYQGWITGNVNKDYWTQNIWGKKYSFYNPIFQNNNHIKFLRRKFDILKGKSLYPIVVFLGAAGLNIYGNSHNVFGINRLILYIHTFENNVISRDECRSIAELLQSENIEDRKERANHKINVRKAIYNREDQVSKGVCPQCGGRLVERNGRYGSFLGCSNYPRCRYTR